MKTKNIIKFRWFIAAFLLLLAMVCKGQADSLHLQSTEAGNILTAVFGQSILGYLGFSVAIYEIIVRSFPTVANWSLLHKVMTIIDTILPNQSAQGGTFKVQDDSSDKMIIFSTKNPK
jgi:hypothetical protein